MLNSFRAEMVSCQLEADRIQKYYIDEKLGTDEEYLNAVKNLQTRVNKLRSAIFTLEATIKHNANN